MEPVGLGAGGAAMIRGRQIWVLGVALAIGPSVAWWLHGQNERLRRGVAGESGLERKVAMLQREHAQSEALRTGRVPVMVALREAKAELADTERRLEQRQAQKERAKAALQANRDSSAGDVLMEHFVNRGRGSPTDAFQSLVWASMTGDEGVLAGLIDPPPPAGDRREALAFENMVTGHQAVRMVGYQPQDAANGVLTIRFRGASTASELPAHFDGSGWRIGFPPGVLEKLGLK